MGRVASLVLRVIAVVWLLLWPPAQAVGDATTVKVEVVSTSSGYTLVRGGEPYPVRGAGSAGMPLVSIVERGGNSVRTWGIETAQSTLDEAHQLGLTVAMGLPVAAERFGFDYDDVTSIEAQREVVAAAVRTYKDHPALLFWIIGNELDMRSTNPRVYNEVNELSRMIHGIDPNHPTTTTITAMDAETVALVRGRAADLDFISLQAYGALALMPRAIKYLQDGPFMITEWGPLGHWEVGKTRWDAPIEPTSTEKARHYLNQYRTLIAPYLDAGLGSYVFLWGQKQERTNTWFSLFTETGESTAAVDALEFAWTGRVPDNQAPVLEALTLSRRPAADSVRLRTGKKYSAKATVSDPDGDALTYQWGIKHESTETVVGGDFEASIQDLDGLFLDDATQAQVSFIAPAEPGQYRIYVMAFDGHGHAAHANIPFLVFGKKK